MFAYRPISRKHHLYALNCENGPLKFTIYLHLWNVTNSNCGFFRSTLVISNTYLRTFTFLKILMRTEIIILASEVSTSYTRIPMFKGAGACVGTRTFKHGNIGYEVGEIFIILH
jgi:hypothetical protein